MYKGGIFLPMDEHVARYCRSSRFRYCQQYLRGCAGMEDAARKHGLSLSDSRRVHERRHEKFPLRVYACDSKGKLVALLSDNAETVDLSIGGLGMLSSEKLEAGQDVTIHFDAGFTIPGLSSKGTICWCEKADDGHYQAGLAFAGDKMGQVVAGLWPGES